jgi:inosine-uridine nucleoside N-ribohydrolase
VHRIKSIGSLSVVMIWSALSGVPTQTQSGLLPYDSSNQVWYDNDFANDYIDWYLMALASSRHIVFRGMTTTSSETQSYAQLLAARIRVVVDGRASGFRNVPDPLPGADRPLVAPASGRIEDTQSIASAGTVALIAAAHRAHAETGKPLVVCVGGPLTAVAIAYLRDPTIAGKVIVAFDDNYDDQLSGYNGQSDSWAAYIVLQRLPLVYFPLFPDNVLAAIPRLSKQWIATYLPPSPARDHMLSLQLDVANDSDGDGDGMTAVPLMAPQYVRAVQRASFGGWLDVGRNGVSRFVPLLRPDENGSALVVTHTDGHAASLEYQRALLTATIGR